MANYKTVGAVKTCNKFTVGDRLDKSVEHHIEHNSGTAFLLQKTPSGFRVTPVTEIVAAVMHAKQEKRNGRQGPKRKQPKQPKHRT